MANFVNSSIVKMEWVGLEWCCVEMIVECAGLEQTAEGGVGMKNSHRGIKFIPLEVSPKFRQLMSVQ